MDLGHKVRDLRKERHLTQGELAPKAGIALNTLNRIENGHLMPTAPVIDRLARALEVNPGVLFEEPVPLDEEHAEPVVVAIREVVEENRRLWEIVYELREELSLRQRAREEVAQRAEEVARGAAERTQQMLEEMPARMQELVENMSRRTRIARPRDDHEEKVRNSEK